MQVVSRYEVACPACRVSYPPEQKRCVHCGGRTAPSVVDMPNAPPEIHEGLGDVRGEEPDPMRFGGGDEMVFAPGGEEADPPTGRRSVLARMGGLLWLAVFAVVTLIRACFGEGGG